MRTCLAIAVVCLPAVGQKGLGFESFLPVGYRNVIQVDLAALRHRGVWDDMECSAFRLLLRPAQTSLGWPFAHLDRITRVASSTSAETRELEVAIFTGNRPLPAPAALNWEFMEWTAEPIGGCIVHRSEMAETMWVQPRPDLWVTGDESLLLPVVEGEPRNGRPSDEVLALVASRPRLVAYGVFDTVSGQVRGWLQQWLGEVDWPADDVPEILFIGLSVVGADDEPGLLAEVVLRHRLVAVGVERTAAAVASFLATAGRDPDWRILWPILRRTAVSRDGCDVVLRAGLGPSRTAIGQLSMLALPMLLRTGMMAREEILVEVLPAPEAEDPPPPSGGG